MRGNLSTRAVQRVRQPPSRGACGRALKRATLLVRRAAHLPTRERPGALQVFSKEPCGLLPQGVVLVRADRGVVVATGSFVNDRDLYEHATRRAWKRAGLTNGSPYTPYQADGAGVRACLAVDTAPCHLEQGNSGGLRIDARARAPCIDGQPGALPRLARSGRSLLGSLLPPVRFLHFLVPALQPHRRPASGRRPPKDPLRAKQAELVGRAWMPHGMKACRGKAGRARGLAEVPIAQ